MSEMLNKLFSVTKLIIGSVCREKKMNFGVWLTELESTQANYLISMSLFFFNRVSLQYKICSTPLAIIVVGAQ